MECKRKVNDNVNEKVKALSNETSSKFHKSILQQNNPLNTLNDIHNQFVFTQKDKGYKNFALTCQLLYTFVLEKQLGLDHNYISTNKTYIPVLKTNDNT